MNIKSLLIGSAAALAAVSGAQAADAIVAAEPEPMEYVRVCDAFGTGYFYIPGTETCLQISGYVRFQADFAENATDENEDGYKAFSRGYISLDAKSDTELGTLTGHIDIQADSDGSGVELDGAWLQLGGFRAGWFYGYWDKGINGETDVNDSGFSAIYNAVSYTYEAGSFSASAAIETFNQTGNQNEPADGSFSEFSDDWGVSGQVSGAFGAVSADLLASYDFDAEEAAIRGLVSADVGPGQLQAFGVWASGANRYWALSEWSVAVSYKAQINEKLSITPGFQYFGSLNAGLDVLGGSQIVNAATGDGFGDRDAWKAGVTLDYEIVKDLTTKVSLQYEDADDLPTGEEVNGWSGFVRLQRSF